eukprot:1160354-Pelagomonas_calceolata.AAC.5
MPVPAARVSHLRLFGSRREEKEDTGSSRGGCCTEELDMKPVQSRAVHAFAVHKDLEYKWESSHILPDAGGTCYTEHALNQFK